MSSHRMISSQVSLTLRALAFHSSNQAKSIAVSWSVRKIPWTLASRKSFVRHAMAISRNYPMYICADPRFASLHCLICWKMRQSSRRCKQWNEKWKNRSRNSEVEVVVENRIRGSERNDAMGVTMIMLCWDCQTTLDWGSMGWWDWLENEAMRRRLFRVFNYSAIRLSLMFYLVRLTFYALIMSYESSTSCTMGSFIVALCPCGDTQHMLSLDFPQQIYTASSSLAALWCHRWKLSGNTIAEGMAKFDVSIHSSNALLQTLDCTVWHSRGSRQCDDVFRTMYM